MKFRVYTKSNCPYCQMAIQLLADNQKEFECYALDNQPRLLNEIKETYRWQTVPVIVEEPSTTTSLVPISKIAVSEDSETNIEENSDTTSVSNDEDSTNEEVTEEEKEV